MKLADAETESVRERLRESNLDDLENAFKEESPLTDSCDDQSKVQSDAGDDVYLAFGKREENASTSTTSKIDAFNDQSKVQSDAGDDDYLAFPKRGENASTSTTSKIDAFNENSISLLPAANTSNPLRTVSMPLPEEAKSSETSGLDPFSTAFRPQRGSRRNSEASGLIYHQPQYQEYNTPPEEYSNRRYILIGIIILLAIIGLAIGLIAPGLSVSSSKNPDGPTPTTPTISPAPSRIFDTQYDKLFSDTVKLLIESEVSPPGSLSQVCHDVKCGGDGGIQDLPVRDRVTHYMVFEDSLYMDWLFSNDFDNVERVVDRYIIILFAFSTGLEKDVDGKLVKDTWTKSNNWLNGKEECTWYGITCKLRPSYINTKDFVDHTLFATSRVAGDPPDRQVEMIPMVTSIQLNKNGLDGDLLEETFKLRHLENFELWKALLRGTIHEDIRLLTDLKILWLHETQDLTGTITTQLGQLRNLESLFIGGNKLVGTIPSEIGNLVNLTTLALHVNALSGPIPEQISQCTKLERLFLDENSFNGTIPLLLGELKDLNDVRLNDNKFSGSLPPQMGALSKLEVLYLSQNDFVGPISDNVVIGWEAMQFFEAWGNKFTGKVSTRFGQLPSLIILDLHSNKLNSEIPTNLCEFNTLMKLDLSDNNKITGKIPAELAKCDALETLALSNNAMTGEIPPVLATMKNLKVLNLDGNLFSGQVPAGLGGPKIEKIRLISNNLVGDITQSLCSKTHFISADCAVGGEINCQNNCCDCCQLSCND